MMGMIIFTFVAACVASAISEPSPAIVPVVGGLNGNGTTKGYWDCCKPMCGWDDSLGGDSNGHPVESCIVNGEVKVKPIVWDSCRQDGPAYICNNQQPFIVNSTLAYGYAASPSTLDPDQQLCCACVLLSFQGKLAGKQMIVQLINDGVGLAQNQFDLLIPGAGVGYFNSCKYQWDAPADGWGKRYGGVATEADCSQLPEELQDGCRFRFKFLNGANVTDVTYKQVECPEKLVANTGCRLNDSF